MSSAVRALMLTGLSTGLLTGFLAVVTAAPGAAAIAVSESSDARPAKSALMLAARVLCMTDEGGGRYKPCDATYRGEHSDWRSTDTCMVHEGDGRFKPCSAEYKKKHMKK
jgi:hypothetical protein